MASNTTNLNLYKVDPLADKDSTFNIKTMLNDNWDKIDDFKENFDSHEADNSKQIPHLGTTTNSGDAYSITTTETINANQKFTIKFNAASSSAPTLKINTGTAYAVKKANGNNAKLYASVYTLFWDGTNFIQLGEGGEYGTAGASQTLIGYTVGTENGVVNGNIQIPASQGFSWSNPSASIAPAFVVPTGYWNGNSGWIADGNLIASNILSGKSIFGVAGTATVASLGGKNFQTGSGTSYTSAGTVTVSGLPFTPSIVIFSMLDSSGNSYVFILMNYNLAPFSNWLYLGSRYAMFRIWGSSSGSPGGISTNYLTSSISENSFTINSMPSGIDSSHPFSWIAIG